jgi:hypothetical protein
MPCPQFHRQILDLRLQLTEQTAARQNAAALAVVPGNLQERTYK